MASLYEIDSQILSLVDPETGEILDYDRLTELQMERTSKIENVALWIKNLKADAEAYKAEKEAFAEREKQAKNKIESLSKWLTIVLNAENFDTKRCKVTFRKSESVDVIEEDKIPKKYLVKKISFAPDKKMIKEAIKAGLKVRGCLLSENQNISIK